MAPDRVQGLTMAAPITVACPMPDCGWTSSIPITVACPMPDCGWTSSIPIADDYLASVIDMLTGSADQVREHHISQHGAPAWFEAWEKLAAKQPGPRRGDHVEAWLKQQRDQFNPGSPVWIAFDQQLDDYRLHADTGTPLHEHCCEGGNVDDCAGCYDTANGEAS